MTSTPDARDGSDWDESGSGIQGQSFTRSSRGRSLRLSRSRTEESPTRLSGSMHRNSPFDASRDDAPPPPQRPRLVPQPPPPLPLPIPGPDGRLIVRIAHLHSEQITRAISSICTNRFSGFPPKYFQQTAGELAIWADKFAEQHMWDEPGFLEKLHSRFAEFYQNTQNNIRKKCRGQHPLDPDNPNYLDWLPLVPNRINRDKWRMLLEYYNSDEFKDESQKNKKNAKSENRLKIKSFGNKSKHRVYEHLSKEAGHRLRQEEFGEAWLGKESGVLEEYRTRLVEKYGPEGPFPAIDDKIYRSVVGQPTRGRWVGVPPQISHPQHFEPPQRSQYEIELEDLHRRNMDEIRDLKCRVAALEVRNGALKAWKADALRSLDSAVSNIWSAVRSGGYIPLRAAPPHLSAGSSSQPQPFQQPTHQPFQQQSPSYEHVQQPPNVGLGLGFTLPHGNYRS